MRDAVPPCEMHYRGEAGTGRRTRPSRPSPRPSRSTPSKPPLNNLPATTLLECPRRRRLSKSVAKAPIAPERARRNVGIPRFPSRPIPARGAFATDLDTCPPRIVPGAPPAPPCRCSTATNLNERRRRSAAPAGKARQLFPRGPDFGEPSGPELTSEDIEVSFVNRFLKARPISFQYISLRLSSGRPPEIRRNCEIHQSILDVTSLFALRLIAIVSRVR